MFLMEGVDYEISVNGDSISKLGGGYWNESNIAGCLFTFEVLKNVENIDGEEITLDSKLICEKNNVTVTGAVSEVNIGINGFNKSKDILIVYKNATYLIEGVDYKIDVNSSKIVSLNGIWNENTDNDYIFTFIVLKEVATIKPDAVVDTDNIVDGAVTMAKLANDVKQAIENGSSSIDLSGYALKSDLNITNNNVATATNIANTNKTNIGTISNLNTSVKDNIVNAINEIDTKLGDNTNLLINLYNDTLDYL